MKKSGFILLLLMLTSCASVNTPPSPPKHAQPIMSPKLAEQTKSWAHVSSKSIERAGPTVVTPKWSFVRMPTNSYGNWQIEATSNLTSGVWFPVAKVYGATNVTLVSDTVAKRSALFYRVKQVK